jgi:hypothetical protein
MYSGIEQKPATAAHQYTNMLYSQLLGVTPGHIAVQAVQQYSSTTPWQ